MSGSALGGRWLPAFTRSSARIELRLADAPIARYERGLESSVGSAPGERIRTIQYIEDTTA
jgi:hypothetical protein